MQPAIHGRLQHKQNRREQNQKRHKPGESRRWCDDEQPGANSSTHEAHGAQSHQDQRAVSHLSAVTEQTTEQTGPQRNGAGCVRHFRIQSEPDEKRESQECAAACDRIHQPGDKRSREQQRAVEERHGGECKGQ